MDQDLFVHLTDSQKDRYSKLSKVFEQPGWKLIEEFARANAEEQFSRAANAQSWEVHRMATGARAAFVVIAALRDATEAEFLQFAEENMDKVRLVEETDFE